LRGYAKAGIPEQIRAAGGEIYAITSEPQALASRAQAEWDFGFEALGDPHHEISRTCRERGWLELFVNDRLGFLEHGAGSADLGWTPQHPRGFFQPGVLALDTAGRVLYRWRSVPTHRNLGGAAERPTAEHVGASVLRALEGEASDAALDEAPPLDSRAIPWPLFVSLLLANGWFVRPRVFGYREGGPSTQRRLAWAALRLLGFTAAWAAAFWWLPTLWVAAALAGWAAWIAPKVKFVNEEFQDVRTA
jgi:hypothetical protein